MSALPDSAAVATPRERWIDVAKGMAIILVVLLHSSFDYLGDSHVWRWSEWASILETFRMPLFFFTAGIFASGALSKPFRELLNTRVLRFAWLYVLWTAIGILVLERVLIGFPGWAPTLWEFAEMLVMPYASTWFIYAIAAYFIVGWLLRRLPLWVQLAIAACATVLFHSGLIAPPDSEWAKVGEYFLFFLLAVEFGPRLRRLVPRLRWWHTLFAPAAYLALLVVLRSAGWLEASAGSLRGQASWFVLSVLAVGAGCSVAILIARWRVFDWLYWLGSKTLQVYLLHWYLLAVGWSLVALVPRFPDAAAPFIVPGLAFFAIGGSLLVWRATRRASFLYAKPGWLVLPSRAERAAFRPSPRNAGRPIH
jgi:uncharacterized membrane protein YcfT